ncbi:MEKHLA domain-containing protein [Phormidium sp. FACHB-592]|uniref:MEKHLA domain-containing protein n=1 Tax=Stenomitos frigidus AS-A4 TaxID=2933935 RepID=A0ABV0KH11_9CYAN|nr:MEKHLA domain-containing protein [Phormidium sp. FACHB-592]
MTNLLPPWQQPHVIRHSERLLHSFQHWLDRPLLNLQGSPTAIAEALFNAPFVVVSHGTEADPLLNYGNQAALALWEMDWAQFTQTPSRLTAEPVEQGERDRLLAQAKANGYISDYQGIRISSTGQRFWIQAAVIWDVLDEQNQRCGQAAKFDRWEFVERKDEG